MLSWDGLLLSGMLAAITGGPLPIMQASHFDLALVALLLRDSALPASVCCGATKHVGGEHRTRSGGVTPGSVANRHAVQGNST